MKKRILFISVILVILALAGYYLYITYVVPTEVRIGKRFSNNLFLLQHDYAYKVSAETADGTTSIYLVKEEGNRFDVWEPGNTGNRLYASALMMDSSGLSITSRFAAEPWNNPEDISSIKKLFATQTGIDEKDITVSGRTIRMIISPVSLIGTGNTTEIECVRYTSGNQPEGTAFIGRKNRQNVLPFEKLDLGSNSPQFREKNKSLFILTIPAYDYSASLPMKAIVASTKSQGDDNYGTFVTGPEQGIAEGSPVFDTRLNLVGVYTSVSHNGNPYYVSHYQRSSVVPPIIPASVIEDYVKNLDTIPDIPVVIKPDIIQVVFDEEGIETPFAAEEGWTILEQKTSEADGIQPEADPGMSNFTTGNFTFYQQRARFRIKIEGEGPVEIGLMADKYGLMPVEYADRITKSGTVDLGILEGSYSMSARYSSLTKVRFVFERLE